MRLNSLKGKIENQAELQVQEVKLNTEYYKLGKNLSARRLAAAKHLEEVLHHELKQLKMEKATFHVNIAERKEPAAYGIDDIVLKASTNPGMTPRRQLIKSLQVANYQDLCLL